MIAPDVPCNGCTLCCRGDAIRILEHEDATQWQTQPHDRWPGYLMLKHKANGDCVYLGAHGCSIHNQPRPQLCVEMDCRVIAGRFTWTQARKLSKIGQVPIRIWERGRELMREDAEEHGAHAAQGAA